MQYAFLCVHKICWTIEEMMFFCHIFFGFFLLYINRAMEVLKGKGQRSWSVALSIADLIESILKDKRKVHSVSTLAKVNMIFLFPLIVIISIILGMTF